MLFVQLSDILDPFVCVQKKRFRSATRKRVNFSLIVRNVFSFQMLSCAHWVDCLVTSHLGQRSFVQVTNILLLRNLKNMTLNRLFVDT